MADQQQPAADLPVAAAAAAPGYFKLADFWPNNPAAWFAQAAGQFHLRGITDPTTKYYLVLAALPEATVELIADLVEVEELPADPFTELRRRLLQAHTLTEYQQVELLFNHPPLGDRRPSELIASMLKTCPRGYEDSPFFRYLFLHRLPRELRVLLSDADIADRRALSERADHLWSHNVRGHTDNVAAVAGDDDDTVAAIRGRSRAVKKKPSQPQQQQQFTPQRRQTAASSTTTAAAAPTFDRQAQIDSGKCYYHFVWGSKANRCQAPCSWTEN